MITLLKIEIVRWKYQYTKKKKKKKQRKKRKKKKKTEFWSMGFKSYCMWFKVAV